MLGEQQLVRVSQQEGELAGVDWCLLAALLCSVRQCGIVTGMAGCRQKLGLLAAPGGLPCGRRGRYKFDGKVVRAPDSR